MFVAVVVGMAELLAGYKFVAVVFGMVELGETYKFVEVDYMFAVVYIVLYLVQHNLAVVSVGVVCMVLWSMVQMKIAVTAGIILFLTEHNCSGTQILVPAQHCYMIAVFGNLTQIWNGQKIIMKAYMFTPFHSIQNSVILPVALAIKQLRTVMKQTDSANREVHKIFSQKYLRQRASNLEAM